MVDFVHRMFHDPVDVMIKRADAGDYARYGVTADHIRQHSPMCDSCAIKKLKAKPYQAVAAPNVKHTEVGEVIAVDKFDPRGLPPSYGGITGVLSSIDACSGYVIPLPVRGKNRWCGDFIIFSYDRLLNIYRLWNHRLRCIRSDRDPVLMAESVQLWAERHAVGLQFSAAGSHQQAGLVERFHQYIRRWIETVYHDRDHLPHNLWFFVYLAGVTAWNNSIHGERTQTAWELFHGSPYDFDTQPIIPVGTPVAFIPVSPARASPREGMALITDHKSKDTVIIWDPSTKEPVGSRSYTTLTAIPASWPRRAAPFVLPPGVLTSEPPQFMDLRLSHTNPLDFDNVTDVPTVPTPPLVTMPSVADDAGMYVDMFLEQVHVNRAETVADQLFPQGIVDDPIVTTPSVEEVGHVSLHGHTMLDTFDESNMGVDLLSDTPIGRRSSFGMAASPIAHRGSLMPDPTLGEAAVSSSFLAAQHLGADPTPAVDLPEGPASAAAPTALEPVSVEAPAAQPTRFSSRIPHPNKHLTSGTFVRVLRHMRSPDEPTIKTALSSPQAEEWRVAI
jgi:hypothetical protein